MITPRGTDAVPTRLARMPAARSQTRVTLVTSLLTAACAVAQAVGLATLLAGPLTLRAVAAPAAVVAVAVGVRALASWWRGAHAARVSAAVAAELRERLLRTVRGPRDAGELPTLLGGLDALDPWFTEARPARVVATVVPVVVVAALAVVDPITAGTVAVTLPLVPLFGALVGAHTARRTARQWGALARLGGHFLDVLTGLATLRAFGRAAHQGEVVRRMADAHRAATVATLRVAFLSALVLELVATLSLAVVAVPVGLRLLAGEMAPGPALTVLLLAPEAFLPLRAAGAAFHAGAEGRTVAAAAFARLDRDEHAPVPVVDAAPPGTVVALHGVRVCYPERALEALAGVDLTIAAGERVAVVGPSGAGKSTLLAVVLGLVAPTCGTVSRSVPDPAAWTSRVAWVPQRPHLFAVSLAENIRLARPDADSDLFAAAVRAARVDEFAATLPDGYDTVLGEDGAGLSAGQAQRVALARAFLADRPVLIMDEPTAHLDAASERAVLAATATLLAGRTALVVTHRPAVLALADRVVTLAAGRATGDRIAVAA